MHSGIWAFKCRHAILEYREVPLFPLQCGRRHTKPAVLRLLFYIPLTVCSGFWMLLPHKSCFWFGWMQGECWLKCSREDGKQREKGTKQPMTARMREDSGEGCDCCKSQSQTHTPEQDKETTEEEGFSLHLSKSTDCLSHTFLVKPVSHPERAF